jgi:2-methylisocitrate lyase-like PEP mutase family enzyme
MPHIVRAARVPVAADIEAAYGETPAAVMRLIADIIEAGAVGINLETARGSTFTQNSHVSAIRFQLSAEAEIVVPADKFEPSVELYQ